MRSASLVDGHPPGNEVLELVEVLLAALVEVPQLEILLDEVSVGALSIDLAEEDDHQDIHGGQEDDEDIAPDFDDEVTIEDGEAEHNEDFGANGMSGEQTIQHEQH